MPSIEEALRRYYDGEMSARAARPLGEEREARLAGFVDLCHREGLSSSVAMCQGVGLDAVQGSALACPSRTTSSMPGGR